MTKPIAPQVQANLVPIDLEFSKTELATVEAAAKAEGLSLDDFIRKATQQFMKTYKASKR